MRTLLISLVLAASFGVPLFASAQCLNVGDSCGVGGTGTCVAGTEGIVSCVGSQSTGNTTQIQSTGNTTGSSVTLINPLGTGATLNSLLVSILQLMVRIGSIIIVLMLVYVGYLFVIARGNPGEIGKAKEALLWTIIGALVLLGAQAIAMGIQATVQALSTGG